MLAFFSSPVFAQSSNDSAIQYRHTVTAGLATSKKVNSNRPRTSDLGFDYLYRFHPKWEVGIQYDLIFEEGYGRHEATVLVPIVAYSITDRVPLFFGMGVERNERNEENEPVVRVGTEYTVFLSKDQRFLMLPGGFIDWVEGDANVSVVLAFGYMF